MLSRKIKVLIFSENRKREGIIADKTTTTTKKDSNNINSLDF
jgi:hypothetical protein